ncbi:RIO1 family regulatory kinase/ATPase [Actinomycetaceae bacterium MB13-C1-2]|nr:RIO1 family regulatory kinase/ATPase [Actinomycetaceae bacterium MB13-C1-2]
MSFVHTGTSFSDPSDLLVEPGPDQRWSTWLDVVPTQRGPRPHPDWVVTDSAAFDTELGVIKSGKEASVYLIERAVPGKTGCLLAAKRFLGSARRDFHRPAVYIEGRAVVDKREARAIKKKTQYGLLAADGHWAFNEFRALAEAYEAGVPVPYPVQVNGTEILMEFIGNGKEAAPRLAQTRRRGPELADAYHQVTSIFKAFARMGYVHGDLSAYNLLDDGERIVVIDLPQMVDATKNQQGMALLQRDVENVTNWFERKGMEVDSDALFAEVVGEMWS